MQKKLMADVFDVLLIDSKSNEVVAIDTLTDAGIDVKVDVKEVRGGKGHKRIATLSAKRDINIKLSNPVWDYRILAMQLGQEIKTGEGKGYASPKIYKVGSSNKITLDKEPTSVETIVVTKDGTKIETENLQLSTKDLTFSSGATENDEVEVVTYEYKTAATSETIAIDSKRFAKAWKVVLKTLEINADGTDAADLQIIFPSAQLTGNFSINTKSERDAVSTDIELQIIEGGTSVQGEIVREPIAAAAAAMMDHKSKNRR